MQPETDQKLLDKLQKQETGLNLIFDIAKIELTLQASFVGCFALKTKNKGWTTKHWPVFYKADHDPAKNQSEYFAISYDFFTGSKYISNADFIKEQTYTALVQEDNIGFSRSVHDYQQVGSAAIDGGQEYCKINGMDGSCRLLNFQVQNGKFKPIYARINASVG